MADVNAPSGQAPEMAPPVRTDDQILPRIRWVPIGKSNCYLDMEKSQGNPIYKIAMDLLKNTNFFRAFTSSSTISSIYIQRHRFHPRPDSSLHLPIEEPLLGYLKFSAKGGVQDPPASKPTQPTKKPKSTAPKAPPRPLVHTPVTSAQPAPTSAPTKPREKKRKQATETSDKPPKAKKSKYGLVTTEDAELQKVLEEIMKTAYALPRGLLPPVVIREPESGKYQPLPEVPGKGKAKVTEEEVSHDLLSLLKHKKTSHADQYIFRRRVSEPTGSSGHDESLYDLLGQSDSEEESKKVVLGANEGGQDEGQAGPDPAGPDPGNAGAKVQYIPSPVVHAGSDREHMDLDIADVSPQPSTEQLDEGFTATAYPKVQESLKLAVEERALLEEPASSLGTLSSLQHLSKDISFGDLFFSDRPSDVDKNAKTKVESMVNVTIQQAMSSISLMISPIIDLISRPESPKEHQQLKATTINTTTTTTTTTLPPPPAQQQSTTEAMMVKRIAEVRKKKKKSRESPKTPPGSPSHQPPLSPLPAGPSGPSRALGASESSQVLPPPPPSPPSTSQESPSKGSATPSPSKTAASAEYQAWTTTDVRLRPSISLTLIDLEMDEDMGLDEQPSDDEDIGTLTSNYSPPPEDSLLAQTDDMATFIVWFCQRRGITKLKPQDLKGPTFEIIKVFHPDEIHLQYQMEECHKLLTDSVDDPILRNNVNKPLPLGGPPGQVTIQSDFFLNKDLEYLRYGTKGRRPALSISKMKAAYYPEAGLEQMVPYQFWINKECKYDIDAIQDTYADLNVVRIEVFSMYGYDYMKKIVLRRADLNEHVIAERDFKYLYPSDFKDLYLLNLQEDFQLGIESYQTQLNLTKPQWDATGFEYKHNYTIIDSPRAVIFRDKYGVQMMMRFIEIHKYSNGTLQQIDEALEYRVKEFRINRMTPGLNTRFWTRKDVDRCKAFMFTIQRRLRTRMIFRNLESFIGGRVREGEYRLLKPTE
nr:hypothetical protein [Tanacetum cinerariifolium]